MKMLKRIGITLCVFIIFALAAFGINEVINNRVRLTEYTFIHPEVPDGFDGYRIMHISDLHEAPFAEQIIKHIDARKPDIVVITGDMVQLPDSSIYETLKIGRAVDVPIYAVTGNHDTQCGAYDEIMEALDETDIIPLDNDSVCLEKGGDTILLLGIKDPSENEVSQNKVEKIRKIIEKQFPDGPCFSILLSHRADLYPEIKDTSADLILSGHLHGGIIRLPFAGGLIGKDHEHPFFPEYEYGLIQEDGAASMIVSGGCDKNPKKKRYFNPPEVVLITLRGEESQ